jgi:hypothetical protein
VKKYIIYIYIYYIWVHLSVFDTVILVHGYEQQSVEEYHCQFIHLSYNGPLESVRMTTNTPWRWHSVVYRNMLENWQRVQNTFTACKVGSTNWTVILCEAHTILK